MNAGGNLISTGDVFVGMGHMLVTCAAILEFILNGEQIALPGAEI